MISMKRNTLYESIKSLSSESNIKDAPILVSEKFDHSFSNKKLELNRRFYCTKSSWNFRCHKCLFRDLLLEWCPHHHHHLRHLSFRNPRWWIWWLHHRLRWFNSHLQDLCLHNLRFLHRWFYRQRFSTLSLFRKIDLGNNLQQIDICTNEIRMI